MTGSTSTASTSPRTPTPPQALAALIEIWQDTPLVEFDRLVETLLEGGDEIFAFHDGTRATNGRIEGTNKPARGAQRVAYGFVNGPNFTARALLATPGMPASP